MNLVVAGGCYRRDAGDVLPEWDLMITSDSANALLTGMVTDTLGFRTPTPHPTLRSPRLT